MFFNFGKSVTKNDEVRIITTMPPQKTENPESFILKSEPYELPDMNYFERCKKLNLGKPQQLRAILQKNGIPVYDSVKVFNHLVRLAHQEKKMWGLAPLANYSEPYSFVASYDSLGSICNGHSDYCGRVWRDLYSKLIPNIVLDTIELIQRDIPEAMFFVTDYAVPRPDPFLGVAINKGELLICDYWHEPGFSP